MNDLLKETGLIDIETKIVMDFLDNNNIKTVQDLLNFDINGILEVDIKNILRGTRDLYLYKYRSIPLPFETYLNSPIQFKYNDNSNLSVDFSNVDLYRMGFTLSEQLDLKAWAKIQHSQYNNTNITLIELIRSLMKYQKESPLYKKACLFVEYYDNDKKMLASENTMSKLLYLQSKLDVTYDRYEEIASKRVKVGGYYEQSGRVNQ